MRKLIALVLVTLSLAFGSCGNGGHRHTVTNHTVHSYCQTVHHDDGTTSLLYWYLLTNPSTGHYYYYSSPTQVTNFSTVTWSNSTTNPIESISQADVQAQPDVAVESSGFDASMQSEFSESNGFETTTSEVESTSSDGPAATEGSESSGFDGGSSESGSSSDGGSSGGDSGGGDGGGGGGD